MTLKTSVKELFLKSKYIILLFNFVSLGRVCLSRLKEQFLLSQLFAVESGEMEPKQ